MTSSTQPGWYDDPEDANGQRYWDGQAWTPHRQKKPAAPSFPPPQPAPTPGFAPPAPPPQAGWQPPGYPPAGPPPQRSNNLGVIIGVIVGVIALGAGGWFGYQHWFNKPKSPEDQIRSIIQREGDEVNANHFAFDPELECKAHEASDQKNAKEGPEIMAKTGHWSYSVGSVHVTGDTATADVTVSFAKIPGKSKTITFQFIKEDGKWKECTPADSSDDDDQGDGDSGN